MSYIITSNQSLDDAPETSGLFKPYSYTNRLKDTIKIEADSEVAVESVKINKNGLFSVNRLNSKYALYFGQTVGDKTGINGWVGGADIPTIEDGTNMPIAAGIVDSTTFEEYTPKQLALQVEQSYGRILMNPLFIKNIGSDGVPAVDTDESFCEPVYDGLGNFTGYELQLKQQVDYSNVLPDFPAETIGQEGLIDEFRNGQFEWENFDKEFECTDPLSTVGCCALMGDLPVIINSHNATDFSFEVDFQQAVNSKSRWCIGLCRKNDRQYLSSGEFKCTAPPYYDINAGKGQTNVGWGYSKQFYDYVVCRQGDFIRVFQSCVDTDRRPRARGKDKTNLVMREVEYYHTNNPTFKSGVYNIETNNTGYTSVAFAVKGEEVCCYLGVGGVYNALVDPTAMPLSTKKQVFTPVSDLQRVLYGKMYLKRNNDILEVVERNVYDHITEWDCENPYSQLSTHLIATNQYDRWGKLLENRDWNNMNAALTTVYGYKKTNSNHALQNYNMILLTAQSTKYLPDYTEQLSAARLLGFDGNFRNDEPVLDPAKPDQTTFSFVSIKRPDLISPKSLFIRLNNFTHNSAVGIKGNAFSKILMHLPRFDNSGSEIGGLYFEPYERLYVALNNPDEMFINEFDIDIVYDNEQYAECIVGKTIVCLHIRPRGTRVLDNTVKSNIKKKVEEIVVNV